MVEYASDKKPPHPGREETTRGRERPAFDDVVGQRELKQALLAVATDDDLDGLLVQGEKGTAKSTAVRGLADLLPEQRAVEDCPYGCHPEKAALQCADCQQREDPPRETRPVPLVTLPLGATRERIVGTLSVADALDGDHEFDPGLLARAHRGILYVDEVNLLEDHLVDVLLDAAASGINRVERDGVSVTHPTAFTMVGTMNPEEGDLRPQLRDRFALQATVTGCEDLDDRVAIIDQALGDDATPTGSADRASRPPRKRLLDARDRVDDVSLSRELREEVAALCRDAGVDGHRGDIATARAARALAALDGRDEVIEGDVERAAHFALPHRLRARPFEDAPDPEDVVDDHFEDGIDDEGESEDEARDDGEETGGESDESEGGSGGDDVEGADDGGDDSEATGGTGGENSPADAGDGIDDGDAGNAGTAGVGDDDDRKGDAGDGDGEDDERPQDEATPQPRGSSASAEEGDGDAGAEPGGRDEEGTPLLPGQERAGVGEAAAPDVEVPEAVTTGSASGGSRTASSASAGGRGARVRTERAGDGGEVDAAASVRAAGARGSSSVESRDLRRSVRADETGALVVFAVDASASMRPAMRAAKGTVLELLKDAYQHRDEVAFVAFAGEDAEVLLPPTDSVTLAARHLKALPTGDRTPLPAGLDAAGEVVDRAEPAASVVVVVTDGRANVADGSPVGATRAAARGLVERDANVVVVDAGEPEDGPTVLDALVDATDATRVPLAALSAERVDASVAGARER